MSSLGALGRVTGAVWALVRNDALLPSELDGLYPPIRSLEKDSRVPPNALWGSLTFG